LSSFCRLGGVTAHDQCNREQTADGPRKRDQVRVKGCGKRYGPYLMNPYLALLRVEFTVPRTVTSRAVRSYRTPY
jgi:hypothetical protein